MASERTYAKLYSWSFSTAKTILERRREMRDGEDLVKKLVFTVRGEETPGRFLSKLATTLADYRTNRAFELPVTIPGLLMKLELRGDSFHYARAAIIAGFIDALSSEVVSYA